jgi:hypothetical protein
LRLKRCARDKRLEFLDASPRASLAYIVSCQRQRRHSLLRFTTHSSEVLILVLLTLSDLDSAIYLTFQNHQDCLCATEQVLAMKAACLNTRDDDADIEDFLVDFLTKTKRNKSFEWTIDHSL